MTDPIKQKYLIAAAPEDVWNALTDSDTMQKWSGAAASFPLEIGAVYSLWDGSIGGEIVEFEPLRRLVQTWKPVDWTREDSLVTFILKPVKSGTLVDLIHENVEEDDYDDTDEGWDIYYLGAIKKMLEARAPAKRVPTPAATKKKPTAKKAVTRKTKPVAKKAAKSKAQARRPAPKKKTAKRSAR
jgi:uncharacterized protein YndB with AHSA1/START domain